MQLEHHLLCCHKISCKQRKQNIERKGYEQHYQNILISRNQKRMRQRQLICSQSKFMGPQYHPGWEIRYVLDVNDAHSTYQIGYSVTTHSSNRITTFTPENILSPRDSLLFSRLELFLFMSLFPPYQNRLDSVDLLLMAFVTSKKTTLTSVLNRPMAVDLEYIGVPLVGKDKR